ncbi:adenosylcobinamide amidohydrolase [Yinghuangia seranimata]|nr:adenosylcobinamide amidohydrolase [Yinghuangia seranimata]MDI2129241.1 adenosylcobinamide amidohydrolase [Yinghuangia seranimata]
MLGPAVIAHEGWPALVWRLGGGWRALSSAILGGGLAAPEWVLNAQVRPGYSRMDPVAHLHEIAAPLGLAERPGVGMMTAALVEAYTEGHDGGVSAWVTTGIGVPTWAAAPVGTEHGDTPTQAVPSGAVSAYPAPGTINILVAVPAPLGDAALVNAVATATEAKVQALFEAGYACTGTPSDAVCVLAREPRPGEAVELFGGPRSVWGARLARAVHTAVVAGARDDRVRRSAREGSSWSP